jgi:hypothetical protein
VLRQLQEGRLQHKTATAVHKNREDKSAMKQVPRIAYGRAGLDAKAAKTIPLKPNNENLKEHKS